MRCTSPHVQEEIPRSISLHSTHPVCVFFDFPTSLKKNERTGNGAIVLKQKQQKTAELF